MPLQRSGDDGIRLYRFGQVPNDELQTAEAPRPVNGLLRDVQLGLFNLVQRPVATLAKTASPPGDRGGACQMSDAPRLSEALGRLRRRRATAIAVLLVSATFSAAESRAAARAPGQPPVHALLDVPYVSQTPELCGGAAVAMVLRYWGERDVFPQDFAPLVSADDGGIFTGTLASAVREKGWQAVALPAAEETARARIRSEIDRGRPLIALIEVGPRTYHYVVIVGATDLQVVLHDPARAPFRVVRWADFDRAWMAAQRWMMLVLPPGKFSPGDTGVDVALDRPAPADAASNAGQPPCGALVERGVQLALAGDRDGADQGLIAATALCPNDPASWRELAGLRFSQSRWSEAEHLALSAIRLAPDDPYAWQLAATSRYLSGDLTGALDAWNHAREPRIDAIDIHGAERTRHPVVARAAGLQPRQVLTAETFRRALRRLRELPVASNARMKYEPVLTSKDAGLAKVDLFIDERQVVPTGWVALAALGARALVLDEVRIDVAGPMGAGELASATWRWPPLRPRVALGLALPALQGFPGIVSGIVSIDGSWERQSYGATPFGETVREERRRVGLHVSDWSASWLRWRAGAVFERFGEFDRLSQTLLNARDYLAVEGALDLRLAADRLAFAASGGSWTSLVGGQRFGVGELLAAWRSTDDGSRSSWSAMSELAITSRVAPLALWPGAGTGQARSGLLRAHPLLTDDVVAGPVFGRQVAHGSLEYVQPVGHALGGGLAVAGFVDAGRAWNRLNDPDPSPLFVDAGVGARVHASGLPGAIRIDVARGLRGGGTTFSAGWSGGWPR